MRFELHDNDFIDLEQREPFALLGFTSPDCMPCRPMRRILHAMTEQWTCTIGVLDITKNPIARSRANVTTLPEIVLLKNGKIIARLQGSSSRKQIETQLETHGITRQAQPAE